MLKNGTFVLVEAAFIKLAFSVKGYFEPKLFSLERLRGFPHDLFVSKWFFLAEYLCRLAHGC